MMRYDFKCEECGKVHEVLQKADDEHKYLCPHCKVKTQRIYHTVPFSFSFWYGYDNGLGEYVDNQKQRDKYLKAKGLSRVKT